MSRLIEQTEAHVIIFLFGLFFLFLLLGLSSRSSCSCGSSCPTSSTSNGSQKRCSLCNQVLGSLPFTSIDHHIKLLFVSLHTDGREDFLNVSRCYFLFSHGAKQSCRNVTHD